MALIAKTSFPGGDPEVNRKVKDSLGREAEIDVLIARRNRDVVFIECKGVNPMGNVDDAEVVKWLDERIPVIREVAKRHSEWQDLTQRFEIWSSGRLTPEALLMISERNLQTQKYEIVARGSDQVFEQVLGSNDAGLIRTYEQHFINHPLKEIEMSHERAARKKERDKKRAAVENTSMPAPPAPSAPLTSVSASGAA